MKRTCNRLALTALATVFMASFAVGTAALAAELDGDRLIHADKEPGNWMTYHGTYKSWHYSPLDEINTRNVSKLTEAWTHVASRANRGLQGFPLAIDGVLYYSSPYNQIYALDGATGKKKWSFTTGGFVLSSPVIGRDGTVYVGSHDGKIYAFEGSAPPAASAWPMFKGNPERTGLQE